MSGRKTYYIAYRSGSPVYQCPYLIEKKDPQSCLHYMKETFCYFVKRQGQKNLDIFLKLEENKLVNAQDCPVTLDQFLHNKTDEKISKKSLSHFLNH
ncbi:MAG: hypothetical protein ACFFDN_30055 [Candidatus Hodarchaeota archaeon]